MRGFLGVSLLAVSFVVSSSLGGCGGCGDDGKGGQLADAPPLVDAPPDMMLAPVTLTVTNLGQPRVGVHVYFINPDGSVAKTADTDATGSASAIVAAGGSVTALKPFQPPPAGKFSPDEIRTFVGVKPGDHLVLSRAQSDAVGFKLEAAAAPNAQSPFSVQYQVYSTCAGQQQNTITPGGSGGGSGDPAPGGQVFLQDCGGTTADLAVVASEDVTPRLPTKAGNQINWLGSVYHGNATLADSTTLDLSGDSYGASPAFTFTYTNEPQATSSIFVNHSPILPHGRLGPFSGDASSGSVTIHEATTPATKAITDTQVLVSAQHEIIEWGDVNPAYTLDLSTALLSEPNVPNFDPATGKLTWDQSPQGVTPDATLVAITVRRTEPSLTKWHWQIFAPYAVGAITYPKLPTDVSDWTPMASDEISLDPVTHVKVPGGYDALRPRAFDLSVLGFAAVVSGASGRAAVVTSGVP